MDRETRDKIFTPFFSSKGEKGTGLGLFISNKIIEQHGGSITVKSTEGEGALFTIRIPKILPESAKVTDDKAVSGQA
jgi:signal transduction histidine kinase